MRLPLSTIRKALVRILLLSCLVHARPSLARAQAPTQRPEAPYQIQWHLQIPMRDGVKLAGTVFRPSDQTGPLPVILALTPYNTKFTFDWGPYFASNGYVFVSVDVRGRGDSEGDFNPFLQEPQDGYDTVEWLAKQPWCNGKVGMTGLSYLGAAQWATAKTFPPHLATIVPVAAVHPGVDWPLWGGIDSAEIMNWLIRTSGRTRKSDAFNDEAWVNARIRDFVRNGQPWRNLDAFLGFSSTLWQTFQKHPTQDGFWSAATPSPTDYRKLTIPILTITGHYDDDQLGALTYYRDHQRHGSPDALARHYLVIGPWDHLGTRTPAAAVDGVTFGPKALMNMNALHKAWFDWVLKDGPQPAFLEKRVACYLQGEDAWRYVDELEDLGEQQLAFHLEGPTHLNSPGGLLTTDAPRAHPIQHLTHDPKDQAPLAWDQDPLQGGLLTQPEATFFLGYRQFHRRALSYLSEPLANPTTICGSPRFSVWVRMDVPDEDLFASLFEVKADGSVVQLGADAIRTRFRESYQAERLAKPGEPIQVVFRQFPLVGRRLAKGSRLKLVLGAIDTPGLQRNLHTGKEVSAEAPKEARVAHLELMQGKEHRPLLSFPIIRLP